MPFCAISAGLKDERGKNAQTAILGKLSLTNQVGAGYNIDIPEQSGVDVMAFDQSKYIADFMKESYDRIVVQIPKGKRDLVKKAAQNAGKSMNQAVVEAIEVQYGIDLSKPE